MKHFLPLIMLALMFALVLPGLLLTGCGRFGDGGEAFAKNELVLKLAVTAATDRLLVQHPDWAAPTVEITAAVAEELETEGLVSLDRLRHSVVSRLNWDKLLPSERLLIVTVVDTAAEAIAVRLEETGLADPTAAKIRVAQVLGWVQIAAAGHLPRADPWPEAQASIGDQI